jgi:putative pyruvate formate lyase activating enzyme
VSDFLPADLALFRSGELQRRAQAAIHELAERALCPRACHSDRVHGVGTVYRTGRYAAVSNAFAHFGEEYCLSGTHGSGTIFLGWCNLHCAVCQNWELSAWSARSFAPVRLLVQRREEVALVMYWQNAN